MRNRSKSRENADPQPSFAATAPRSRSSTKLPAAKVAPRRPRLTSHWAKPGERLGNDWGTLISMMAQRNPNYIMIYPEYWKTMENY